MDVLRKAIKAVVESVDVLHGTFFTEGISAHWKLNEHMDESNYFLYVDTDGDPVVTANSLSLLPVYAEDKVQIHCTLVQGKEKSCVVVRMSHLVVDGGDGKYLLAKLAEAYNMIAQTGNADRSYRTLPHYQESLDYAADYVVFMMGSNDSKPENWKGADAFQADLLSLLDTYGDT